MSFPPAGFPPTCPPLGRYPEVPAGVMVMEAFRLWSPGPEEECVEVLPLTMVGVPPTAGTAGVMAPLPFSEIESDLPCCPGAMPPTGPVVAEVGGDCFLVALA